MSNENEMSRNGTSQTPGNETSENGVQNTESDGDAGGTSAGKKDDRPAAASGAGSSGSVLSADSIRLLLVAALVWVTVVVFCTLALVWFLVSNQEWRNAAEASLKRIEMHLGTSFCSGEREFLDDVIYFGENGHSLDAEPAARKKHNDEALKSLAERLAHEPGRGLVLVIGSASVDGDVLDNQRLSEQRAHEVVEALKEAVNRELEASAFWFRARWRFVAVPRGESYENPADAGGLRPAAWKDENRRAWVELCRNADSHEASEQAASGDGGLPAPLRLGLLLGVFALAATLWWRAVHTGDTALLLLGSLQAGVVFVAGLSAWWWDAPVDHPWAGPVLGLHTTTVPYPFTVQNAMWIVLFLLVGYIGSTLEAGRAGGQGEGPVASRMALLSGLWRDGGK